MDFQASQTRNYEVIRFLKAKYKKFTIKKVYTNTEDAIHLINFDGVKYEYVAKRLLDNFPEVSWVFFEGGFQTYVYSRETLKWAGYKMKTT